MLKHHIFDNESGESEGALHYGPHSLANELKALDFNNMPETLQPGDFKTMPDIGVDEAVALHRLGYDRIGAAILLYDETGRVIFGKHQPTTKNPQEVWSLPSETAEYTVTANGSIQIESSLETALRCLNEELGLTRGELVLPAIRSWHPTHWPIGSVESEQRVIWAPFIPLQFKSDGEVAEQLSDLSGDGELSSLALDTWASVIGLSESDARRGVVGALAGIMLQDTIDRLRYTLDLNHRRAPFISDYNLLDDPRPCFEVQIEDHKRSANTAFYPAILSDILCRAGIEPIESPRTHIFETIQKGSIEMVVEPVSDRGI